MRVTSFPIFSVHTSVRVNLVSRKLCGNPLARNVDAPLPARRGGVTVKAGPAPLVPEAGFAAANFCREGLRVSTVPRRGTGQITGACGRAERPSIDMGAWRG